MKKSLNKNINQAIDNIELSNDERSKLIRARQQALTQKNTSFFNSFTAPVWAYASLFLAIGLVSFSALKQPSQLNNTPQFNESFALITSQDSIELYENLEFYMWIDAELSADKSEG